MAERNPPNADVHPMRIVWLIPKNPPPQLYNRKAWSPIFHDFIAKCLVKDPKFRPSAAALLSHKFIQKAKGKAILEECVHNYLRLRNSKKSDNDSDSADTSGEEEEEEEEQTDEKNQQQSQSPHHNQNPQHNQNQYPNQNQQPNQSFLHLLPNQSQHFTNQQKQALESIEPSTPPSNTSKSRPASPNLFDTSSSNNNHYTTILKEDETYFQLPSLPSLPSHTSHQNAKTLQGEEDEEDGDSKFGEFDTVKRFDTVVENYDVEETDENDTQRSDTLQNEPEMFDTVIQHKTVKQQSDSIFNTNEKEEASFSENKKPVRVVSHLKNLPHSQPPLPPVPNQPQSTPTSHSTPTHSTPTPHSPLCFLRPTLLPLL